MMNFVLALLLSLLALTAPAQALCVSEPTTASCCCQTMDDCSILQGTCCGASEHSDALPVSPPSSVTSDALPVRSLMSEMTTLAALSVEVTVAIESKPVHLASNKLYILKRSFLI